jgi:hypothetical protein
VRTDELGVEIGFAVLQKHIDHFSKVSVQFVECFGLGVSSGEAT